MLMGGADYTDLDMVEAPSFQRRRNGIGSRWDIRDEPDAGSRTGNRVERATNPVYLDGDTGEPRG